MGKNGLFNVNNKVNWKEGRMDGWMDEKEYIWVIDSVKYSFFFPQDNMILPHYVMFTYISYLINIQLLDIYNMYNSSLL